MNGKCPKCEKLLPSVQYEEIKVCSPDGEPFDIGTSVFCPICKTILSVHFDIAENQEGVFELLNEIKQKISDTSDEAEWSSSKASEACDAVENLRAALLDKKRANLPKKKRRKI